MANANETTNTIIKNVQLFWLKLDKPVSPFGVDQYEISIQVPKKREKELAAFGKTKVLPDGKTVSLNLKKKAFKADGEPAAKVRCVDASKNDLSPKIVGNGSVGNVMVMQRPYEIKNPKGVVTKTGISTMLIAVQVTELIKYVAVSKVDFDSVESNDETGDDDSDF